MTAGLPRSRTRRGRKHSLPMRPSYRSAGLSMMDGSVRGSYDITYAKSGVWRHRAFGRA